MLNKKKILVYSIGFVAIASGIAAIFAGTNKFVRKPPMIKQPVANNPIIQKEQISLDKNSVKKTVDVLPEKAVQEEKKPEWFENVLALHDKYYPGWQQAQTDSSQQSVFSSQSNRVNGISGERVSSVSGSQERRSSSFGSNLSSSSPLAKGANAENAGTGSSGTASSGGLTSSGNSDTGESGGGTDNSETEQPDEPEEPDTSAIRVIRFLSPFEGGSNVGLDIMIQGQATGIIVTENIPQTYSITSSTPQYSKVSGKTYKWLLYGKEVLSQTIEYKLSGSGEGEITGSYKSSQGGGSISGDSQLGGE